jgi:putative transposase
LTHRKREFSGYTGPLGPSKENQAVKKSRFSEEQIVGILKESEAGMATRELCRKHGIAEQTFYRWKSKYGGMNVSEAQRLKQLEDENRKLKQMVADLMLDKQALQAVLSKNW